MLSETPHGFACLTITQACFWNCFTQDKALSESTRLLNRYYIPLKYPSHYPVMNKEQAEEAIRAAKAIRDVVKNLINIE